MHDGLRSFVLLLAILILKMSYMAIKVDNDKLKAVIKVNKSQTTRELIARFVVIIPTI